MLYIIPPSTKQYELSYRELKNKHETICAYDDEVFLQELPDIIHFACLVSYFKQLSVAQTLSDEGIIHQLVHLLHIPDEPTVSLTDIRKDFEMLLKLS